MPDSKKTSELTAASTPLSGAELVHLVQSGNSRSAAANAFLEILVPFSKSGTLAVTTGVSRFRLPFAGIVTGVATTVNTAPTGATILVDVDKNGTTIFSTQGNRPSIAISGFASSETTPDVSAATFSSGDYLTVDIDQVGSTVAGADLTVTIRVRRTS